MSALNGGRASRLLYMALDGEIEIAISEPIIKETIRVLREKFEWPPYDLHDARQRLERLVTVVDPQKKLAIVADEPDNRILECAAEAGSEFIITEDKALLRLKQHGKAKIVSISQFSTVAVGKGCWGRARAIYFLEWKRRGVSN